MKSRTFLRTVKVAITPGIALGILFLSTTSGIRSEAQTAPKFRPTVITAKSAPAAAEAHPTTDATQEKLHVYGQWKIVVKNADGSTASTTEFENSLADSGFTLLHLLQGSIVPDSWAILLSAPSGASTCGKVNCLILTSSTSTAGSALCTAVNSGSLTTCYSGMTYSIPSTGTAAFQLVGGYTATASGSIISVGTYSMYCYTDSSATNPLSASTTSPATCSNGGYSGFKLFSSATSSTTPAFAPVSVTSGQTVQVTVAFSFS